MAPYSVGWLFPKQGPNPSKPPQIAHKKIAFFDPNFTFCFPKSHKNPGVGGWVNRFGKDIPKKSFFLAASLRTISTACEGNQKRELQHLVKRKLPTYVFWWILCLIPRTMVHEEEGESPEEKNE